MNTIKLYLHSMRKLLKSQLLKRLNNEYTYS